MAEKDPGKLTFVVEKDPSLSTDIPAARNGDSGPVGPGNPLGAGESFVVEKESDLSSNIPAARDSNSNTVSPGESFVVDTVATLSTDLPLARDKVTATVDTNPDLKTDLPLARDKDTVVADRDADLKTDLPLARDKDTAVAEREADLSANIQPARDVGSSEGISVANDPALNANIPAARDSDYVSHEQSPDLGISIPAAKNIGSSESLVIDRTPSLESTIPVARDVGSYEGLVVDRTPSLESNIPTARDADVTIADKSPDLRISIPPARDVGSSEGLVVDREPSLESSIPTARDVDSAVADKSPDLGINISAAKDVGSSEGIVVDRTPSLESSIPTAKDVDSTVAEQSPELRVNIPSARDVGSSEGIVVVPVPSLGAEIPVARDGDSVTQEQTPDLSVNISAARSAEFQNKTTPLQGQWLPDFDPAEVGAENYKDLTNLRYGTSHPEGVGGYSKINTVPLQYQNIKSGHQLKTGRDTSSYVVVQADNATNTGEGIDSYTKLMLHCNGPNASTSFMDSSASDHTMTAVANAQIQTAVSKFATGSCLLDGTGDYLTAADHADWYMGTNPVTIDCWVRFDATAVDSAAYGIFQHQTDNNNMVNCYYYDGSFRFSVTTASTLEVFVQKDTTFATATWFHIAVIRGYYNDWTRWVIAVDGVAGAAHLDVEPWADYTGLFEIGRAYVPAPIAAQSEFLGSIDEFRVSKGIARWTEDFTVPSLPYDLVVAADDSKVFVNETDIPDQGNFLPSQLHVSANAASDPYGNEAAATTGWDGDPTGGTIAAASLDPHIGTYYFSIEEATAAVGEGALSDAGTLVTVADTIYSFDLDVRVIAGSWTIDIRNSADTATVATLETIITNAAYVSKSYEWTAQGTNERIRIVVDTAANGQIYVDNLSVYEKAIYEDSSDAGIGRFSDAPSGNLAYCNGAESCIWAGDQMRVAAMYSVAEITTSPTDLTFAAPGPPDTITTAGGVNWQTLGFVPGRQITITACSIAANIGTYVVTDVTATVLSVATALTAGGVGAGTATIEMTIPRKDPIDYTEAVNNELQTTGNVFAIGGGIDSETILMLHCDGTNRSTTFTDSSSNGLTVTAVGNAQIDTSAKKFGTASGYFDGTGDEITVPTGVPKHWFMDTDEFTIDFWVNFNSLPAIPNEMGLFGQRDGANDYVHCTIDGIHIIFASYTGGVKQWLIIEPWKPSLNTWYHVAVIRGWDEDEDVIAITIDGSILGTETTVAGTDEWPDLADVLNIGSNGGASYADAHIDEFRVSKPIARWTSNFVPPGQQYEENKLQWWTFSTRPARGIEYKLLNVNGTTSTSTIKTWDGSGLAAMTVISDGTSTGGVSLAQDGTMDFESTIDISKPFHFNGLYLYAYLTELSAGEVTIYASTIDAPFQKIVDVWDGTYRQPVSFQRYIVANKAYDDYTLEVNFSSDTGTAIGGVLDALATTEHVIIMFEERMAALYFKMYPSELNVNTAIPTIERWNGTDYVAVGVLDETISDLENWESLGQTGIMSWHPPDFADEPSVNMFGVTGFAYRLTFDGALSASVTIDRLFGIPAQKTIRPFAFPAMYRNQLFLFGFTEGNQGNRADYCLPNAPDVWNGDLTSNDGLQSLFFGGAEDCVGAVQLYNRFGANIFSLLLVLKHSETYVLTGTSPADYQIFTISNSLGCIAPLTIATAEVAFQVTSDVVRNIAIWVSHAGPVVFDGTVLAPLRGIDSYFDPNHDNYLTMASIANSRGWYDSLRKEYNITFPDDKKWFVYDMIKRKWFLKDTGTAHFPKSGFPVLDTDGLQYIYTGIDSGHMVRQENGNTWEDGGTVPITQTLETGDFFPTGNIWDKTRLQRFKLAFVLIPEDGVTVAVQHYADTGEPPTQDGTALTGIDADDASTRVLRDTQRTNLLGWSHRFKFSTSTSDTDRGFQPISWGYQYDIEREDD